MDAIKNQNREIESRALRYLEQDTLSHMDMIEVIRRGFAEIYYAGEEGVALKEQKGNSYFLSVVSPEAGERMADFFKCSGPVFVHQEFMVELLFRKLHRQESNKCYQMVYLKEEKALDEEAAREAGLCFQKLDCKWLDRVCEIYHLVDNREYIRFLLEEGVMHGAFVEGELAGFVGLHAEGCMGLLEVIPAFRRQGIGEALERFMIDWNRERGYVPFCQVIEGNEASMGLQKKIGLTMADKPLWWLS